LLCKVERKLLVTPAGMFLRKLKPVMPSILQKHLSAQRTRDHMHLSQQSLERKPLIVIRTIPSGR
jgi:hypothetical protein